MKNTAIKIFNDLIRGSVAILFHKEIVEYVDGQLKKNGEIIKSVDFNVVMAEVTQQANLGLAVIRKPNGTLKTYSRWEA